MGAVLTQCPIFNLTLCYNFEMSKDSFLKAISGSLFVLPFLVVNFIIAQRIEPFFSLIRPGYRTSFLEYMLLGLVIMFLPVGAYVSGRALFTPDEIGIQRFYILNALVSGVLLILFGILVYTLGTEIYRCDIKLVPNCD